MGRGGCVILQKLSDGYILREKWLISKTFVCFNNKRIATYSEKARYWQAFCFVLTMTRCYCTCSVRAPRTQTCAARWLHTARGPSAGEHQTPSRHTSRHSPFNPPVPHSETVCRTRKTHGEVTEAETEPIGNGRAKRPAAPDQGHGQRTAFGQLWPQAG